jgi:DNA-binding IclR family transcriptional regulator
MGKRVAEAEPLPEVVDDLVAALAEESGETASIVAPAGTSAVFLRVVESPLPIRYFAQPGHRVPIHASSSGRALLAQHTFAERQSLYRKIGFGDYPKAPGDAAALEATLAREQELGYHLSDGEFSADLVGVSVPLGLPGRRLSITIAGPRFRCFDRVDVLAKLLDNAVSRWLRSAAQTK